MDADGYKLFLRIYCFTKRLVCVPLSDVILTKYTPLFHFETSIVVERSSPLLIEYQIQRPNSDCRDHLMLRLPKCSLHQLLLYK